MERIDQCLVILLMGAAIGAELEPAVKQQPFLVIESVVCPAFIFNLLKFFIGRGKLPGIQVKTGMLQTVEAVEIFPAGEDRVASMRGTGMFHKGLKGGGANISSPCFDP